MASSGLFVGPIILAVACIDDGLDLEERAEAAPADTKHCGEKVLAKFSVTHGAADSSCPRCLGNSSWNVTARQTDVAPLTMFQSVPSASAQFERWLQKCETRNVDRQTNNLGDALP